MQWWARGKTRGRERGRSESGEEVDHTEVKLEASDDAAMFYVSSTRRAKTKKTRQYSPSRPKALFVTHSHAIASA